MGKKLRKIRKKLSKWHEDFMGKNSQMGGKLKKIRKKTQEIAEKNSENSNITQKTEKKTQEMADKNSENVQKRENMTENAKQIPYYSN